MMEVVEMVEITAMVQMVTQVPVATTDSKTCSSWTTLTKLYFVLLRPLLWRAQDCLEEAFLLQVWLVLSELGSHFLLLTRESFWMRKLFRELARVWSHHQVIRNGPPKNLLDGATSLKCETFLNLKLVQGKFPKCSSTSF